MLGILIILIWLGLIEKYGLIKEMDTFLKTWEIHLDVSR